MIVLALSLVGLLVGQQLSLIAANGSGHVQSRASLTQQGSWFELRPLRRVGGYPWGNEAYMWDGADVRAYPRDVCLALTDLFLQVGPISFRRLENYLPHETPFGTLNGLEWRILPEEENKTFSRIKNSHAYADFLTYRGRESALLSWDSVHDSRLEVSDYELLNGDRYPIYRIRHQSDWPYDYTRIFPDPFLMEREYEVNDLYIEISSTRPSNAFNINGIFYLALHYEGPPQRLTILGFNGNQYASPVCNFMGQEQGN